MSYHNHASPDGHRFVLRGALDGSRGSLVDVAARGGRAYAEGGMFVSARTGIGGVPALVAPTFGGIGAISPAEIQAMVAASKKKASAKDASARKKKFKDAMDADRAKVKGVSAEFKKAQAHKLPDGRVKITTPWSEWNTTAAKFTAPFKGVIDAMPVDAGLKGKLKLRPLDALWDILDPIEDRIAAVCERVMKRKGYTQTLFGQVKNIRLVQDIDKKCDTSTQNMMKRLRVIEAFLVLFFTQPVDLGIEMAKEGFDIVGDAFNAIATVVGDVAEKAGEAVNAVKKKAEEAVSTVASWFGVGSYDVAYYRGVGDAGVVSAPAAGGALSAVAAALGVSVEFLITTIIGALVSLITATLAAASSAASKIVPALFAPKGGAPKGGALVPKGGGLAPAAFGPADTGSGSGSGVPLVAVIGVAGVVAFLMFKK